MMPLKSMQAIEFGGRRWITLFLFLLVVALSGTILFHAIAPNEPFIINLKPVKIGESTSPLKFEKKLPLLSMQPPRSLPWKPQWVSSPPPPPPSSLGPVSWSPEVRSTSENVRLRSVLQAATMKDKTVIVATLNAAWSTPGSIFDVFLESFKIGNETKKLLNNLVIFNFDPKAYARCKSLHPHCFALITDDVDFSSDQVFMSPGYLNLVWKKLDVLRMVLQQGYNFIFSDIDIMWFRNPFPQLNPDADFQSSCDLYVGNPASLENMPNTGFMYVKANYRTTKFFNYWYESRLKLPGRGQQGVFNVIKYDNYTRDLGISLRFLSNDYFGGICEPAKDLSKVCTMHANCCAGLDRKVHDLRIFLNDWRKYLRLTPRIREIKQYTWSILQLYCGAEK